MNNSNYECHLCYRIFKTKQQLTNHNNAKNRCNEPTDFQCINCLKFFRSKYAMKQHSEKNGCSKINKYNKDKIELFKKNEVNDIDIDYNELKYKNNTDIDNQNFDIDKKQSIKIILKSDFEIDKKIKLIKAIYDIDIDILNDIINKSSIDIDNKILLISQCSHIEKNNESNITTNNFNNQITNNIQINNFNNENISYLDKAYFDNLLKYDMEKAYLTLTKDIYLRLDHPENRTIRVENINNKYAYVFERGKWRGILKSTLKELLYKKNTKLIKIHLDLIKDVIDEKNKNKIKIFLGRDFEEDPYLKEVNDKMVLLFYSGK